jgi:predicted esterase
MIFLINKPDINYRFWVSVPPQPARVVFWFHGSTTEPVDVLAEKRPLEFELALQLLPPDCIVVTPMIPKVVAAEGGRVIDPQCLSRNVMFDDLIDPAFEIHNRPDREVLKIFAYLEDFFFPVLGRQFNRFGVGGFSAGGNFASLFAVLHPRRVSHMMSIISCAHWLPVERIGGVRIDYPYGAGNLGRISRAAPDPVAQRQVKYFIYHGALDDHDPIDHFADNDPHEAAAIRSVTGRTALQRAEHALGLLRNAGFNVEWRLAPGSAHEIHSRDELKGQLDGFLRDG